MHDKLFEAALGINAPWSVKSVEFDAAAKLLTVLIDFAPGTRFGAPGLAGQHPVHDTVAKDYRHLNFFQHECHLRVRTPRVKLPDGSVRIVEPEFAGRLAGFTLLFEAMILMLAQQMPFAAVARIVGNRRTGSWRSAGATSSWHSSKPTSVTSRRWPASGRIRGPLLGEQMSSRKRRK